MQVQSLNHSSSSCCSNTLTQGHPDPRQFQQDPQIGRDTYNKTLPVIQMHLHICHPLAQSPLDPHVNWPLLLEVKNLLASIKNHAVCSVCAECYCCARLGKAVYMQCSSWLLYVLWWGSSLLDPSDVFSVPCTFGRGSGPLDPRWWSVDC